MPSVGKNTSVNYSGSGGQIQSERLDSSINSTHTELLSPANLSDHAKYALKAAVESSDKSSSSIALLASHAIGDGQMTLHSVQQAEVIYKKLLDRTPYGPEELTVRARINEFQMYDILDVTHSRSKDLTRTLNIMCPPAQGYSVQEHVGTSTSRLRHWTSAATLSAQYKLGFASPARSLPVLTEKAKMLIKEIDVEHAVKKIDKLDVRKRFQDQVIQNQRRPSSQRVSDTELWMRAIDDAKRIQVSNFSIRENLQLQKGITPRKAKLFALINTVLYPVGRLRDKMMSDQTRARLNAEAQKPSTQRMPDSSERPSSLGSLTFAHPIHDSVIDSDDESLQSRLSEDNPSVHEVDRQAYQSLSLPERQALDALIELIDEHGFDSAVQNMTPEIRQSFDGYQLRRNQLLQYQSSTDEQAVAM